MLVCPSVSLTDRALGCLDHADQCHLASGAHEAKLYQCQGCSKQFRGLADLHQHASNSDCSARTSRQMRTFLYDAQQSQLMLADRTVSLERYYEATLHFDGGAQPNPGDGGWGFVLVDDCGTNIAQSWRLPGSQRAAATLPQAS